MAERSFDETSSARYDSPACADVRDDLELLVLDALEPDEATRVRLHVAGCSSCRSELAALESVAGELFTAMAPADPPDGLSDRIVAARRRAVDATAPATTIVLDDGAVPPTEGAQVVGIDRRRRPGRVGLAVLAAASAALLVGVAVGVLIGRDSGPSTTSSALERVGVDQVRTGVLSEWAGGGGTVVVTSGARPTLIVTLDQVRPGVPYGCVVLLPDGSTAEVGSWTPAVPGETSWAVPLDDRTATATEVRIVGTSGQTLSSAPLS